MNFAELSDIVKKDVPLHYRNEYTARALFNTRDGKSLSKRIEFTIERSALGKEIKINFLDSIDYPLLPILKSLKEHIGQLDSKGLLL